MIPASLPLEAPSTRATQPHSTCPAQVKRQAKGDKIEHRLFSHISGNWAGQPLTSHEVAVNLIAGTTTRTGLTVHAERDTSAYPRGIKVTDREMKDPPRRITPHQFHGRMELHHHSRQHARLSVLFISRP
jgi:hypothetical protein